MESVTGNSRMSEVGFHRNTMARIVWICGVVYAGMFLLLSFTRIGLAALDHDFSDFSTSLFFGVYGIIHLVINNAFKTGRQWGRIGLLVINALWVLGAIASGLTVGDELSQLNAVFVGIFSASVILLVLQERNQ